MMNLSSEDFYWIVAVNTRSGSSVTVGGTRDADMAAGIAATYNREPDTRAFVAGKR